MQTLWQMFLTFLGSSVPAIVNACVYLLIIALFVLSLCKCVAPVWRTRQLLRRGIKYIRAGEKSRHSWQEDTFLGKGALYPHWSEYLDNLFFADGEYHNASNVENFINEETVIEQPGRRALAQAVPGLMVTVGFLGTLLGITQGLSGFSMESSEAVMGAIRKLIPGMQTAFLTSICGVVCSVAFTVISGIANGAAKSTLSDFYAAMHNDAGVLTVDPLNQIAIYQQEQTAQIQAIAADISGQLGKRLQAGIRQELEPVCQTLERFCQHTTRQQTQAMDMVVGRFLEGLDRSLSGQLSSLSGAIAQTVQWQKDTREDMVQTVDSVARIARDALTLQRANEETSRQLTQCALLLSQMAEKQKEALLAMEQTLSQVQEGIARAGGLLTEQSRAQAELLNALLSQEQEQRALAGEVTKLLERIPQMVAEKAAPEVETASEEKPSEEKLSEE